jgi:hypothetical protein
VILLAAATLMTATLDARVEDVRLLSVDSRPAVRMRLTSPPARVAIYREGELTRVSLEQTDLGVAFSGSDRFKWTRPGPDSSATPWAPGIEALYIQRGRNEVSLLMRLPPDMAIEVRRELKVLTLVFREPLAVGDTRTARSAIPPLPAVAQNAPAPAPSPEVRTRAVPPPSAPAPRPVAASSPTVKPPVAPPVTPPVTTATDTVQPTVIVPAQDRPGETETAQAGGGLVPLTPEATTQLLRTLGASPPEAVQAEVPLAGLGAAVPEGMMVAAARTEASSPEDLYKQLFPETPPPPTAASAEEALTPTEVAHQGRTLQLGFLTFRPSLRLAYVNANVNVTNEPGTAHDKYFQIQPGIGAAATLWDGRFRAEYEPTFRGFGSYDVTQSTTHRLGARVDLPVGERFRFRANDSFLAGTLEAQEVDPGGEFFFDLAPFHHNLLDANASYEVAPRWRIEGGGSSNLVRFSEPGGFYDYDQQSLHAGVGFDLTPRAQAGLRYVHERVPRPDGHVEAESSADTVEATASGDVTAHMTGQLTVGYRSQDNPLAGEGGQHFSGPVFLGSLTRAFGRGAAFTLGGSRGNPLSAFESNGFYVSTEVSGALVVPLPLSLSVDGGIGYRWNDYRVDSLQLGVPREDRIFGWRVALRRSLGPGGSVGVGYQRQRRKSNLEQFDNTTDGLLFQLEFNVFSAAGFR